MTFEQIQSRVYSRCWPAARLLSGWCWAAAKWLLLDCPRLLLDSCWRLAAGLVVYVSKAIFWPRSGLVLASFWTRSEPPKICYQNVHESCVHIVFWSNRWHFLDVFVTLWTLQLDAVCNKRDILPKHTWIMRSHGVWLSKHIVLLIIFHSLKPLGWLAFWLCFAHLGW